MSLTRKKQTFNESYIDFTNEQIRALEATETEAEFDALMYDFVEDHNVKWFISEGLSEREAMRRAKENRRKAGG